jgi:hypothetical protein
MNDLWDRIRFCRMETKRKVFLKKLHKNVLSLARLLPRTPYDVVVSEDRPQFQSHPRIRRLVHDLHSTLKQLWTCGSITRHEAKLCLRPPPSSARSTDWSYGDSFDILLYVDCSGKDRSCQEANVALET